MYRDYFPPLVGPAGPVTAPCTFIAVITTNERIRPSAVLAVCKRYGAESRQTEGTCYWVLFADEPKRPWPFTESALLASADKDGYMKCESYKQDETKFESPYVNVERDPSFMMGDILRG